MSGAQKILKIFFTPTARWLPKMATYGGVQDDTSYDREVLHLFIFRDLSLQESLCRTKKKRF